MSIRDLAERVRIALRAAGLEALAGSVHVDADLEGVAVGPEGGPGCYLLTPVIVEAPSLKGAVPVPAWQVWSPRIESATRNHPEEHYEVRVGPQVRGLDPAAAELVCWIIRERILDFLDAHAQAGPLAIPGPAEAP